MMPEVEPIINAPQRCPLSDSIGQGDSVWSAQVPETCWRQCEGIWDKAEDTTDPEYDLFANGVCGDGEICEHGIEVEDRAIRVIGKDPSDANREFITLDVCAETGDEIGNAIYKFRCPYANILPQVDSSDG